MGGYANDYFEPPNFIYMANRLINLDGVRLDFFYNRNSKSKSKN
jgi:hypothetical protein